MISALWDILSSMGRAFFQVISALVRGSWDVLSALASAVLWPVRAINGVLFGTGNLSSQWTPLYFLTCGLLAAALAILLIWALWINHRKRHGP